MRSERDVLELLATLGFPTNGGDLRRSCCHREDFVFMHEVTTSGTRGAMLLQAFRPVGNVVHGAVVDPSDRAARVQSGGADETGRGAHF